MQLRQAGADAHAKSRLKKALFHAQSLVAASSTSSLLDAEIYKSWIAANLSFERQQWSDALVDFRRVARAWSFMRERAVVFERYCGHQMARLGQQAPIEDVAMAEASAPESPARERGGEGEAVFRLDLLKPEALLIPNPKQPAPKRIKIASSHDGFGKACNASVKAFKAGLKSNWKACIFWSAKAASLLEHSSVSVPGGDVRLAELRERIGRIHAVASAHRKLGANDVTLLPREASLLLPVPAKPVFYDLVSFDPVALPLATATEPESKTAGFFGRLFWR